MSSCYITVSIHLLPMLILGLGGNAFKLAIATAHTDLASRAIDDLRLPKMLRRARVMAAKWASNSSCGQRSLRIYRRVRSS